MWIKSTAPPTPRKISYAQTHVCQPPWRLEVSPMPQRHKMDVTFPNHFHFTEIELMVQQTKYRESLLPVKFHWSQKLCLPILTLFSFNVVWVVFTKASGAHRDADDSAVTYSLNRLWHSLHLGYGVVWPRKTQVSSHVMQRKNILLVEHKCRGLIWGDGRPSNAEQPLTGMELTVNTF